MVDQLAILPTPHHDGAVAKLNVGELAAGTTRLLEGVLQAAWDAPEWAGRCLPEDHCTPGFQRPVRQPTGSLVLGKVGLVRCRERPARWIAAQPHDDRTAGEPRTPHLCWPRAQ